MDLSQIAFKEGDDLQQVLPTRTVQTVLVWDSLGRSYSLDPAEIPKGRGDGVPIASLIDLQNGASVVSLLSGSPDEHYLLAHSGGYGFIAKLEDLHTRLKAGKAVMNLDTGETTLPPVKVYRSALINPDCKVVLASAEKRLLAFPIAEMKIMAKGRGLQLMALQDGDRLLGCNVISQPECVLETVGARGKIHTQTLNIADVENKRGRKGMVLEFSGSLKRILASET